MKIKIKKFDEAAIVPNKKTKGAAGYDIYSIEDVVILPGFVVKIRTGIALEIPEGYKGEIYSRSGLASKGVVVANQPGKIDSDYRGEVFVILTNISYNSCKIKKGQRIAQFEVEKTIDIEFEDIPVLSGTKRGSGGFGSTGE